MKFHGVTTMPAIGSCGVIEHGLKLEQIWQMIQTWHIIEAANATGIVVAEVPPISINKHDWRFTGNVIADCYLLGRHDPTAHAGSYQHYLLMPAPLALPGLNLEGKAAYLSYGTLPAITGDGELAVLTENAWQQFAAWYMMNLLYELREV